MDSSNERHVFECITHACNEGGKQYVCADATRSQLLTTPRRAAAASTQCRLRPHTAPLAHRALARTAPLRRYFLLTPKLLPDLDYGEDTVVQLVFNGPWMERKDAFTLSEFC